MPVYAWQGRDARGGKISGTLAAPTEAALDQVLRDRGLYVTAISERAPARAAPSSALKLSRDNLIVFTVHLATILAGGISITRGLAVLLEEARQPQLKAVTQAVIDGVSGGAPLSDTMARLPMVFPEFYVNLMRAGETTGNVETVLLELVSTLEWQRDLVGEIRQASTYPIIMLSAVVIMLVLFGTMVLPKFNAAMTKMGAEVSGLTWAIMAFGDFIVVAWPFLLAGLVGTVVGAKVFASTPRGRYVLDWIKLELPVFGDLVRKVGLSRFAHHLALLHKAGVDFAVALHVVANVTGNAVLARALAEVRRRVMGGSSLSAALRASGQCPPLVLQMVASGETSGSLSETLSKVAKYYDREVPATVRRVSVIIEPIVYVILGVVVLATALALYAPLVSMLRKMQARPRF